MLRKAFLSFSLVEKKSHNEYKKLFSLFSLVEKKHITNTIGAERKYIFCSNQDWDEAINFPVVGQTSHNWDENDDNSGLVEEQPVNISQRHANTFILLLTHLDETIDAPVVGQTFCNWEEIDCFISFYAKTQNFVSIIHGSEYNKGVCRIRQYACEHQGHNGTKNKTNIVKNQ
ncbi:hypothetical protein F8M41_014775 [Gigaspora margarita]|uniref:Uncharacterized protein n=1 Tax=Gigaspora margarita TaxID=4874 RepID=A0A8H3WUX4_GIGMA|nr:hypothetical protein F8M41_014775 [Gigaspora margarita]